MNYEQCPKCGQKATLMYSHNPGAVPICFSCINEAYDYQNLKDANVFCRTFDIAFDANQWITIANKEKKEVFRLYAEVRLQEDRKYRHLLDPVWDIANTEWDNIRTHDALLEKINIIKKGFLERALIKWGPGYTFNEYLEMENLFIETVKSHDLQDPLHFDNLKKACRLSVDMNKSILEKKYKDLDLLSKSSERFLKAAGIDPDSGAIAREGTISTVADLCAYLEKNGFEFNFYDKVERDVVDHTIQHMKEYTRTLVLESTGLEIMLDGMQSQLASNRAMDADHEAFDEMDVEKAVEYVTNEMSDEFNDEVSKEFEEDDLDDMYDEEF